MAWCALLLCASCTRGGFYEPLSGSSDGAIDQRLADARGADHGAGADGPSARDAVAVVVDATALDSADATGCGDLCASPISASEIVGHWKVDSKDVPEIFFKAVKGQIRGVYDFNKGRTLCSFAAGQLDCWWTESSKSCDRKPPSCAGREIYTFTRATGAAITGVNRWASGDSTSYGKPVNMTFVSANIPATYDVLLDNDPEFIAAP